MKLKLVPDLPSVLCTLSILQRKMALSIPSLFFAAEVVGCGVADSTRGNARGVSLSSSSSSWMSSLEDCCLHGSGSISISVAFSSTRLASLKLLFPQLIVGREDLFGVPLLVLGGGGDVGPPAGNTTSCWEFLCDEEADSDACAIGERALSAVGECDRVSSGGASIASCWGDCALVGFSAEDCEALSSTDGLDA